MNQKSKYCVALVTLILLLVLIVCTCAGCIDTAGATEATEAESPRFIIERAEHTGLTTPDYILIITDTETGAQYLFVKSGYGAGLTVLEPAQEEDNP